jgi:prepilin-type N-terminal cleavage/methylation domain-containing protein
MRRPVRADRNGRAPVRAFARDPREAGTRPARDFRGGFPRPSTRHGTVAAWHEGCEGARSGGSAFVGGRAMRRTQQGFTLIELMIVVIIIGILAAIAIPNFHVLQDRAHEGSTKANMHTFQLAAEDYGVQNDGVYADNASQVGPMLPSGYKNPFSQLTGSGVAWKDQAAYSPTMGTGSSVQGIVAYADSATQRYCIAAHGAHALLPLHLLSGN